MHSLTDPLIWQGLLLLLGLAIVSGWRERFWLSAWQRLPAEDWRRDVILPTLLALYALPIFLLSWSLGEPFWLLGRVGLLMLLWVLVTPLCSLLRQRYWIRAAEVFLYIVSAYALFPELRAVVQALDSIRFELGEIRISLASLLQSVAVLSFALYVGMGVARWIEQRLEGVDELSHSLRVLLGKIARLTLLLVAGVAAVDALGIDLTVLKFLGGGLGLGIGFGLQKVISNLVSGLILLADRSIKPGDVIEVEDTYGWINNLRARFVSVITRDGKEHLIPNEDLITQRVVNWSFSDSKIRVHMEFGVSYGSDVLQVRELALACVAHEPRILPDPKPVCFLTGFGDSSVDFQIRFWIADPQNGLTNIRSAVNFRLWEAFKQNNIEIPFPQRDVHIRSQPQ